NIYVNSEEYEEAIKVCNDSMKLNCSDWIKAGIYNKKGYIYVKMKKDTEAIKAYKKAIELEPLNKKKQKLYKNLGDLYFDIEKYREAINVYREAVKLESSDELKGEIYKSIGNSYYRLKEYKEAIDVYKEVEKLECSDELKAKICWNLCNIYFNSEEYEEAIKVCNDSMELNCSDWIKAGIYSKKGYTYVKMKEDKEAIKAYKKAIELEPLNNKKAKLYMNIGILYEIQLEYKKAIKNYKKSLEIENDEGKIKKICFEVSYCYEKLNDIENFNIYLARYNDNKFYNYIENMDFDEKNKNEIKVKIYKLFNNVIRLRDEIVYKGECKVVGHYTKVNTLKHLIKPNIKDKKEDLELKKSRLRLNNVAYMNDPTEGEVFLELLLAKVKEDKESKEFIKNLYITKSKSNREVLNRKSSVFLTSFSKAIDTSLPMWVQYSDDGQGCCITIKSDFFDKEEKGSVSDCFKIINIDKTENLFDSKVELVKEKNKNDECYCLYEIQYLEYKGNSGGYYIDDNNKKVFNELVECLLSLKQDILDEEKKEHENNKIGLKSIIQNILDQIRFLFKDKNYEHEKELRLIKFENNGKVKYTGENEGFIVPHVYIEMDKELEVEEVILGPKAKNPMEVATYLYYTDKVKQVSKSKIKYK
ncbi:tetratricopeptide repeat protein, partial [Clostridium perfringens]|nr:tetratricopeptide repeat protein [Clostridium perfringens]